MPFLGSPKQNSRRAELTENREKEFQKVDVEERKVDFDERNPTAAFRGRQSAEAPERDTLPSPRGGGSCRFSEARSKMRAERSARRTVRKSSRR